MRGRGGALADRGWATPLPLLCPSHIQDSRVTFLAVMDCKAVTMSQGPASPLGSPTCKATEGLAGRSQGQQPKKERRKREGKAKRRERGGWI